MVNFSHGTVGNAVTVAAAVLQRDIVTTGEEAELHLLNYSSSVVWGKPWDPCFMTTYGK